MADEAKNLTDLEVDPLEALLNVDTEQDVTDELRIPRLKANFVVKAPPPNEYRGIRNRCMSDKGKGRNATKSFDSDKFARLLVYNFTVKPAFTDPRLQAKFKGLSPEDVVDNALFPGEIEKLADKILELGGYGDGEADLVEQAKN